ncbi:hypothetical protein BRD05_10230 [Halobacteriales archaeon QS_9_70_65]|nr:MAG: hypothetical protein BRD05_10230 [Halobacteriales archaeon QS_9_70_65]
MDVDVDDGAGDDGILREDAEQAAEQENHGGDGQFGFAGGAQHVRRPRRAGVDGAEPAGRREGGDGRDGVGDGRPDHQHRHERESEEKYSGGEFALGAHAEDAPEVAGQREREVADEGGVHPGEAQQNPPTEDRQVQDRQHRREDDQKGNEDDVKPVAAAGQRRQQVDRRREEGVHDEIEQQVVGTGVDEVGLERGAKRRVGVREGRRESDVGRQQRRGDEHDRNGQQDGEIERVGRRPEPGRERPVGWGRGRGRSRSRSRDRRPAVVGGGDGRRAGRGVGSVRHQPRGRPAPTTDCFLY